MTGRRAGPGRALLFDLDGTLTDNYAGIAASIRHAFDCLDLPPPDRAKLHGCVGPPLRESFARLLEAERIAPSAAVMVGDRGSDVRAAHANAVRAVGVLWGYGTREELAGPDALVATPQELPHALRPR
jgi:phosphoglycolate phosphatase-like HAD superfamily hydrolase